MADTKSLKSRILKSSLLIGGTGLLAMIGASCASRVPTDLGLVDGKLRIAPTSPNCVCSEYPDAKAFIEPIAYDGSVDEAWETLKQVVVDEGGTIEKEEKNYRWFTFTSRIFRFVDDVEFRLDREARLIHIRSASRIGYSDLGVNRKRMEVIRADMKKK